MSAVSLMAEFETADSLVRAARTLRDDGHRLDDAFTPFPIPELGEMIESRPTRMRNVMLAAGLLVAAFAFALQWYSAVIDYPINSGGRPLNSWPVFLLVPFEVGILAAAVAGAAAFLWGCGLPRLHDPVFNVIGFERATQDRFFLLVNGEGGETIDLRHALRAAGARTVSEVLK
jgi:hypothetical protein